MAFGFQGPIGDGSTTGIGDHGMVDYALSRTYRILSADRNQQVASCKVCGTTLRRDHGFKVSITGLFLRTPKDCYLCQSCFTPVKAASEHFPLVTPPPSWWRLLDRKPVSPGETPPVSERMSGPDIDGMIKQREKRRKP